MSLPLFFFYVFSTIAVASAFMVISARNPVHSVLYLILVFVNAAGLFMLAGAEFLALILIVVYVGAVAVLFDLAGEANRSRSAEAAAASHTTAMSSRKS